MFGQLIPLLMEVLGMSDLEQAEIKDCLEVPVGT